MSDLGKRIFCRVTAINLYGSAFAYSNVVGPVVAASGFEMLADAQAYVDLQRGMFIHFNTATFLGAESIDPNWPVDTFAPTGMNIDQWVQTAQAFGANYAVLTIKHEDGFCLWPTTTTDRTVGSTMWYATHGNPDIVQEFCNKCRAADILPIFYYNCADRHWAAAHPGFTYPPFRAYQEAQITEILTRYAPIPAIWLDSTEWWFGDAGPWDSAAERSAFIHGVAPGIIIVNNSHTSSLADTDIVEYEEPIQGLPPIDANPKEACTTMCGSWFWQSDTQVPRDAYEISNIINIVNARNSTFLLNLAPNTAGVIPDQFLVRAMEVRKFRGEVPQISPVNMTSNTTPAPYVASASSEYPGFPAYVPFNVSLNSIWSSNAALPQWIQIDLGTNLTCWQYMIQTRPGLGTNQWTAWTLAGSLNGTTWTTVDTRTQPEIYPGEARFYDLPAVQTYRYWRWTITATVGGSGADCARLSLYGPMATLAAPVNTIAPVAAGATPGPIAIGKLIKSVTGTWTGYPIPKYTFQWYRAPGTAISGAIDSTYTVVAGDDGFELFCRVTAFNLSGPGLASADSNHLGPVGVATAAPVNTGLPVMTGTTEQGQMLTSTTGTWTGTPAPTYTYRWYRSPSTLISGAVASTYTLVAGDVGLSIMCRVTATNTSGVVSADSNIQGPITVPSSPAAPINVVAPAVTGITQEDSVLTTTTGTWSGSPAPTYTYQWIRVPVPDLAPVNTIAPEVTGTPEEGAALTTTNGTWTGSPTPIYTYQWVRVTGVAAVSIGDRAGSTIVDRSGATINVRI